MMSNRSARKMIAHDPVLYGIHFIQLRDWRDSVQVNRESNIQVCDAPPAPHVVYVHLH